MTTVASKHLTPITVSRFMMSTVHRHGAKRASSRVRSAPTLPSCGDVLMLSST